MALEYCSRNAYKHDSLALSELEQIIKTQFFDLFQITDWFPGKWIKAREIFSATDYTIEDISLSNCIDSPGCLNTRIAKVNNTWITVGSNPLFIPLTYTPRAQKMMAKGHPTVSAKDIIHLYIPQKAPRITPVATKRKSLSQKYSQMQTKYHLKTDFLISNHFYSNSMFEYFPSRAATFSSLRL